MILENYFNYIDFVWLAIFGGVVGYSFGLYQKKLSYSLASLTLHILMSIFLGLLVHQYCIGEKISVINTSLLVCIAGCFNRMPYKMVFILFMRML